MSNNVIYMINNNRELYNSFTVMRNIIDNCLNTSEFVNHHGEYFESSKALAYFELPIYACKDKDMILNYANISFNDTMQYIHELIDEMELAITVDDDNIYICDPIEISESDINRINRAFEEIYLILFNVIKSNHVLSKFLHLSDKETKFIFDLINLDDYGKCVSLAIRITIE